MLKSTSVLETANSIKLNKKPTILGRFFKSSILKIFKDIKIGYIELIEDGESKFIGEKNSDLKVQVNIYSNDFYVLVGTASDIGLAEAYAAGLWSSNNPVDLLRIILKNQHLLKKIDGGFVKILQPLRKIVHQFKKNTLSGSKKNIVAHYDLSNDFFKIWLDKTMTYSSAIFTTDELSLEEASIEKIDRLCRKLDIKESDNIIEIGSGWGSFALHAVRKYGCHITTTTISEEQYKYVEKLINESGLSSKITLLKSDYRDLKGKYDKLVSIEMIEAVGYEFIPEYFNICSNLLKKNGIMAIQGITYHDKNFKDHLNSVDFIKKYIFPGSNLISVSHLTNVIKDCTDLSLVHFEDITMHYAKTLNLWRQAFNENLDKVKKLGYSDEFIRIWEFYFIYCEAGFKERFIGDIQFVMAKSSRFNINIKY